jgi:PAS domain S-box-containing protein
VIDQEGVIRYQSPSTPRVLGYAVEEMTGRMVADFINAEDRAKVTEALQRVSLAGHEKSAPVEFRIAHRDGSWRIFQSLGKSMAGADGARLIVVNSRDITESRRLEEQLRQSQKMEAIGQLSSGVAHDFNNLLTIIKGYIGLLRMKDQISPDMINAVQQIDQAADRASNLTRQLLMFSRQQSMQPNDYNLNGLVSNLTKMLRRLLTENIEMFVECTQHPLMIRADEGMVEQVLLNLVVNARDAMPKGGNLSIATEWVDLDENAARKMMHARPGPFVSLVIRDSGIGISAEVLPRIFEPFFTTKGIGKGTGLGLATVYGIMQQHDGWIAVESVLGRGTTFRAYFPRLASAAMKGVAEKAPMTLPGGHEGILLVEDEAAVRQIAEAGLASLGYRVYSAPSGLAALQVWQSHKQNIELLMTDLIMPDGVTGRELAVRLREEDPHLRIVYMSGYSNEVAGNDFQLREGINYLSKPFDLTSMAKIVRVSLDRGATQAPFGRSSS